MRLKLGLTPEQEEALVERAKEIDQTPEELVTTLVQHYLDLSQSRDVGEGGKRPTMVVEDLPE